MQDNSFIRELADILDPQGLVVEPEELLTYESDGLRNYRVMPGLVVLPTSTEQVAAVVRLCHERHIPVVPRGSGTGLSAGALPIAGCVLIALSRMRSVLELDLPNQRASVQAGVFNLSISKAAAAGGYYFAPDPSSQQVCTVGGNVAENAGGAHCLKYGFTSNHVLGMTVVLNDGSIVRIGGKLVDGPGYDLAGVLVGSEGTLGIVTEVTVRLVRKPEAVMTLQAAFPSTDAAGGAVSGIIGAGLVPAAIEMMDKLSMEAAEAAVHANYPVEAGAILIVELDGPREEVDEQMSTVQAICGDNAASSIRIAKDDDERALIWKGRKSAFAAVGRISPDFIVQDGVIPRTALPAVLREIASLAAEYGLRVANVFHAGDGNLHPLVLFDKSVPGQTEHAEELAGKIIGACVAAGGSITGEHGVGFDKKHYMSLMFSAEDMDSMQRLRCALDPERLFNPDKVFPTPKMCGERASQYATRPLPDAGIGDLF